MTARVVLKRASRAVWLKRRRGGLGGSDVAAVLGMSPYATQLDVWLDKTGRATSDVDTYPTRRGTFLEPYLLAEYARAHPDAWMHKPPALLAHPDYPMIQASLDGLADYPDRTVVVECKTAGWRAREPWWDEERLIPDHYAVQVLTYLAVTGMPEAHVVADVAGDFTEVTIMRDPEWEAAALGLLADWWQAHVVADVPPAADWERDTVAALNRAWATAPGESVEASAAAAGAVEAYRALSAKAKALDALTAALRVQVREHMRSAQVLTIGGEKAASIDSRGTLRFAKSKEDPAA